MPNKNYIKGVKKERFIVNSAKKAGLISFRSAGSHSPIDVVVIDTINKRIKFVQCKPDSMSLSARLKLLNEMIGLNDNFKCSFEVI